MKYVIASLLLVSMMVAVSPAQAARRIWFRRTTSTCPNGQCPEPAPAATKKVTEAPAEQPQVAAAEPVAQVQPVVRVGRRIRVRFFRR